MFGRHILCRYQHHHDEGRRRILGRVCGETRRTFVTKREGGIDRATHRLKRYSIGNGVRNSKFFEVLGSLILIGSTTGVLLAFASQVDDSSTSSFPILCASTPTPSVSPESAAENENYRAPNHRASSSSSSSSSTSKSSSPYVDSIPISLALTRKSSDAASGQSVANLNSGSSLTPSSVTVSYHSTRGPRAAMEDRTYIARDLPFFAVFDGHGGWQVAETARRDFYPVIKTQFKAALKKDFPLTTTSTEASNLDTKPTIPNESSSSSSDEDESFLDISTLQPDEVKSILYSSFSKISEKVLKNPEWDQEGSTVVAVLLAAGKIYSLNVGDSRAVLCRRNEAIDITTDHKPNSPSERKRIEALGGKVRWYGYLGPDRQPVTGMGAYRINGNLAVSRALGDSSERPFVSSEPEILDFDLTEDDRFIILASDGLWDVMTSQEAVEFVQQILDARYRRSNSTLQYGRNGERGLLKAVIDARRAKVSQYLVEESLRRGTTDNVSVVVVWLR